MIQRKKHTKVSDSEWGLFIKAIDSMHGTQAQSPQYKELVKIHVDAMTFFGSSWGVHSMGGSDGRNFLAWHRQYLLTFEKRLQKYDNSVFIPYWDWENDITPPEKISAPSLLKSWSVERNYKSNIMPTSSMVNYATSMSDFDSFQDTIENVHNSVHIAVGGDMRKASSPTDPIFWLHHANIDRIWLNWQNSANGMPPLNLQEKMMPLKYLNVEVGSVVNVNNLDYGYTS